MILSLPKFTINTTILILNLLVSVLDSDVPRSTSYGVYNSQLILFARAPSQVAYLNARNKLLTQKLLNKAIGFINFAKYFINFIPDTMI